MDSMLNILSSDTVGDIIKFLDYEAIFTMSKNNDQMREQILQALRNPEVAKSVFNNEKLLENINLDEYDIDYSKILVSGIENNLIGIIEAIYETQYFGLYEEVLKTLPKLSLFYQIRYVISKGNKTALQSLGKYMNEEIYYWLIHEKRVEELVILIHPKLVTMNRALINDIFKVIMEANDMKIKRQGLGKLIALKIIEVMRSKIEFTATFRRIPIKIGNQESFPMFELYDILFPLSMPHTSFRAREKAYDYLTFSGLTNIELFNIFGSDETNIYTMLTSKPTIFLDDDVYQKFIKYHGSNNTLVERVNKIREEYHVMIEKSEERKLQDLKTAVFESDYGKFVGSYTDYNQILDIIPDIESEKILQFLKSEGFKLQMLKPNHIIGLIFGLPDDVKLFEIFDDKALEMSLLAFERDVLTSDLILKSGIHLDTLLKFANVKSEDMESIQEELMYADIPENIADAIQSLIYN